MSAPTSEVIKLPAVRLSFPRLFTPKAFQPGQEPRFEATFLLDPSVKAHAAALATVKSEAKKLLTEIHGKAIPKGIKTCWADGNDKQWEGYEDMVAISTHNKTRPTVVGRDRTPLVEADGTIYAGCYVNGSLTLWVHPKFPDRVNANLRAVQFVKDGPAFSGMKPVDAEEEFEALEDEDDNSPAAAEGAETGEWDDDDDIPF